MALSEPSLPSLQCPTCDGSLHAAGGRMACPDCAETVPVDDGIVQFPVTVEEQTVDFFEYLSPVYESPLWFPVMYRLAGGPFAPPDDRTIIEAFLDPEDKRLLDVACGTGRLVRYVADDTRAIWGIDLSERMLRNAKQRLDRTEIDNVAVARMGADELHFESGSFERVACCWAVHFFSDIPRAVAEIRRVLTAGGVFAGCTLADEYILSPRAVQRGVARAADAHVFEQAELEKLLQTAGFERVEFDRRGAVLFFKASVRAE